MEVSFLVLENSQRMKKLLTIIFTIISATCFSQISIPLFTADELKGFIGNPGKVKREIEESQYWFKYYDNEEDSLIVRKYGCDDRTLIFITISDKDNAILTATQIIQKYEEDYASKYDKEVPKRYDLIINNGWKEFYRENGTGRNILSLGFKKDNIAIVTAEYTDYYRETACLRSNLRDLQSYLR